MKIEVYVSTNKIGSECRRTVEVDDDSTPDDIEQIAQETMWNLVSWGWKQI